MKAPIFERLENYAAQNRVSFAMPAHKRRTDFSAAARLDVTELAATADLHAESEAVREANEYLARAYGAKRSFILTGGSTAAVHAMISAAVRPGETLLATPDCHMSAVNICAVAGINMRAADIEYDSVHGISRGTKSVLKYLNKYPDIRAVFITSPTYYGMCSDIRRIAYECHTHGKPLIVDEAHGAHFIASERLPETSVKYADMVCQSAHKTLNALTGAAYLHVNGSLVPPDRVRRFINIFETSSPSYVIAASADTARAEAEGGGWEEIINLCAYFRGRVKTLGVNAVSNDDITRIALNLNAFDITGYETERILSKKYGIDIEMADMKNIVLITSPQNTPADFDRLYAALREITAEAANVPHAVSIPPPIPRRGIIKPMTALFSDGEDIKIDRAEGRVSRACVTAYPPGTPVIFPGEKITTAHINLLLALADAGAKITGMNENKIDTVKE